MRLTTAVATLATTLLLAATSAASASDVAKGSLSAKNRHVVAYPGCRYDRIAWSVNFPAGMKRFGFTITVTDPTGEELGWDYIYEADGTAGTTKHIAYICGSSKRGIWTVSAPDAEWTDSSNAVHQFTIPETTFTLRSPRSHTLATHGRTKRAIKVLATVKDERATKYVPAQWDTVLLQRWSGRWKTIQRGYTKGNGKETFSLKPQRAKLRVYTPKHDGNSASASAAFRVH